MLSSTQKTNLKMGYCCINMSLRKDGIFTSRTCRLKTLQEKGIAYSYELATQNLKDLATIIAWNHDNNISLFRMSSEMFPFATHPDYYKHYNLDQFKETLISIGKLAKEYNQRLTFHPGQYNQLTSVRESVVEKSIIDIDFHAKIMDYMELDSQSVIVIHGGSKQGGKADALSRFCTNFASLSKSSQSRLVLENCEMAYSVEDLLPIANKLSIPIVLDYHHHNLNPSTEDLELLTLRVLDTWKCRNIIPLFHLSESREGVLLTDNITKRRAHSDYIKALPVQLLKALENHVIHVDIEAKCKELAVRQLKETYQIN
jgi:UV damage endonuclease UvdE